MLALTLAASVVQAPARAAEAEPMRMDLWLGDVATPLGQKTGEDMPVYFAYSTQTSFTGGREVEYLEEPLLSNTLTIPRSSWGGPGADEWVASLGVTYGPGPVHPTDGRAADNFYIWAGFPAGVSAAGGEDLGHLHTWFTDHQPWLADPEPSGSAGTLGWEHRPGWSSALEASTHQYTRLAFSQGTATRSPVATGFDSSMFLDHAYLEARGGDVTAPTGGLAAPVVTMGGSATPIGRDMAFQMVTWTAVGSYFDAVVTPDWTAGRAAAMTGAWRLPVAVSLPAGGKLPARRDLEDVATPQYTLPVTALGIPSDENQPPGEQVVRLVTDLRPGQRVEGAMAIRLSDGSLRSTKVVFDEPGRRTWRVQDGRLVLEPDQAQAYALAGGATAELSGASPAGGEMASSEEPLRLEVNAAGRPVARDVRYGTTTLFDSFDVVRLVSDRGSTDLGSENRDGRAVILEDSHAAGTQEQIARAAYKADGTLVIVQLTLIASSFSVFVQTHPLDGGSRPHHVESVADLAEGLPMADPLTGPVEHATTLLEAEIPQPDFVPLSGGRLVLGEGELPAVILVDAGGLRGELEVRNRSGRAAGEPLVDPLLISRTEGPTPLGAVTYPVYLTMAPPPAPATSGRFTGMRTYRLSRQRYDVLGETRDFDGAEPLGIAFSAVNAAGQPLPRSAISSLFIEVRTLGGEVLYEGTVSPTFSPDGGATWGVSLVPIRELEPSEVIVYARARHAGGMVRTEESPAVPAEQWRFRVDRIPVTITGTAAGVVRGITEPRSFVSVRVPELGLSAFATADIDGAFSAQLDLTGVPGGEYEVLIEAVGPGSEDPEKPLTRIFWPNMTDLVPDDEVGTATARLRHLPGGADPALHRTGPPIDEEAAEAFLRSNGGVGESLRTTAWTVRALGLDPPAGAPEYLGSLGAYEGSAWRAGEPASAAATGLAAEALARLGEAPRVDAGAFLRWDGGAAPAPGADASSLEATARLVLGMEATGRLGGFDPWWRAKIARFLEAAVPATAQETFERAAALGALATNPVASLAGTDLDAVAYRVLLGTAEPDDLAAFQTDGGGFTLRPDGDTPEALPTALALAAVRGAPG